MKTTRMMHFAAAIGLMATPATAPVTPATAFVQNGEDATRCLSLDGNKLANGCGFVVTATWCVENVDCRNGRFTNTWNIGAYSNYPVYGADTGNYVRWGACKGSNTLSTHGTAAYSYEFYCN